MNGFDFYAIGFAVVGVRDVHLDSSTEAVFGTKSVFCCDPDHLFVEVFDHFGSLVAVCGKLGLTFNFNYQGVMYADWLLDFAYPSKNWSCAGPVLQCVLGSEQWVCASFSE